MAEHKDNEMPAKWRTQARQFFLTYPHCSMAVEDALSFYQDGLPVHEYIVAVEPHKDGTPHLHVYLNLSKKTRVTAENFDLQDGDETYHGNYQKCRNAFKVQKYCKKGGDFITNMEFNLLRQALNLAQSGDVAAAFDAVAEARPDMILTAGTRVQANLQMVADREAKEPEQENLRDWVDVPEGIARWNRQRHVLWLFDRPGWARRSTQSSCLPNHCW